MPPTPPRGGGRTSRSFGNRGAPWRRRLADGLDVRRAHPLIKLALLVCLSLNAALATSYSSLLLLNAGAALFLALARPAGRLVRFSLLLFLILTPGSSILFLAAGWEAAGAFLPGAWLGLDWLGLYLLRMLCILLANVALVAAVTPRQFTQALRRFGLPPRLVLFVMILVRFLPASLEEARRIVDVQRCRGFRPASLLDPRNFLPILTPLFVAHLKRAHDMALCLEIRHFFWSAPRTRSALTLTLADATCLVLGLLCCVVLTV